MKKNVHIDDFTRPGGQVTELDPAEFMPLPPPYDKFEKPPIKKLTDDQRKRMDATLDGVVAIGLQAPGDPRGGEGLRRKIPGRDRKALLRGRQLDLSPAPHAHPRVLREVPDLLRRLSGLRLQRSPGHLPAHDAARTPAADRQHVRQEGASPPQEVQGAATSTSTGRPSRASRSWPTAARSAAAAPRSASSAATTPS